MKSKTLLYLTSSYPYGKGESFVADELNEVIRNDEYNVIVSPMIQRKSTTTRKVKAKVIPIKKYDISFFYYILISLISPFFWIEIKKLPTFSVVLIVRLLLKSSTILKLKQELKKIIIYNDVKIVYSFWNDVQSYACCLLKREGYDFKLISRVHGFDLYKYVHKHNHMFFKDQFQYHIDHYVCLSDSAAKYLNNTYSVSEGSISVIPLGVNHIPDEMPKKNNSTKINIISCSFCNENKNLDVILEILSKLALVNKKNNFIWTHVGDGPTLKEIKVKYQLLKVDNLECDFLGYKTIDEINKNYTQNYYDFFINASNSEGQPVSIMEAMSYGIPIAAPNIGGIPSMLSNTGCILFKIENGSVSNQVISELYSLVDNIEVRDKVRKRVQEVFFSQKNTFELMKLFSCYHD